MLGALIWSCRHWLLIKQSTKSWKSLNQKCNGWQPQRLITTLHFTILKNIHDPRKSNFGRIIVRITFNASFPKAAITRQIETLLYVIKTCSFHQINQHSSPISAIWNPGGLMVQNLWGFSNAFYYEDSHSGTELVVKTPMILIRIKTILIRNPLWRWRLWPESWMKKCYV